MLKLGIIGAGRMASVFANRCHDLGIESHAFAWTDGAYAKDDVDYFHDVSVLDIDAIEKIAKEVRLDGVVATTELTIYPAAEIAHRLGLAGHDPKIAKVITDKYRNREATKHVSGLHHPKYCLIDQNSKLDELDISYPVIVKPTSEGGKRGVTVVNSENELMAAIDYAVHEKKDSSKIVIEEYIAGGQEYSVESLSTGGKHAIIQITRKQSSGAPHCVELGHHQPAQDILSIRDEIVSVMERALVAVGVSEGCCHSEIKIVDGKIYLIEFNARPGGDFISYPLTELSTGYPYITGIINCALGRLELPNTAEFKSDFAGVIFLTKLNPEFDELFRSADVKDWLVKKHVSELDTTDYDHNSAYTANYIMYHSDTYPEFLDMVYND